MNILLIILMALNSKTLEARFTEQAPVIDGVIEEVWNRADSAYNFFQIFPYVEEEPSERTTVYVLQDEENLYLAFRCYADSLEPINRLSGNEDDIRIAIDPFGSKTTAYYFIVSASEIMEDGWLLDDGRRADDSWDGVWYRAVKLYDDRYEVEVKIPFKSIRYKKGLDEWGLQFARYIAENKETNYWTEVSELEWNMITRFGILKDIQPHATGNYFELYPEGFLRYDNFGEEKGNFNPNISLNFKWDLTPEASLNATLNPDFAQIESDPFELNLGRYPTYLDERRPFFLEGKEIFRMSDFGEGKGFFSPLEIFYSRKIGKSVNGEVVPILGGIKFTNKSEEWNLGGFGAYTNSLTYLEDDTLEVTEPRRSFGVLRVKRSLFENSDIGMLFSGTMADRSDYNYAFGIDGVYRKGFNQLIIQGAASDKNKKRGLAFTSCYFGFLGKFLTVALAEVVQDSFDVSDIGYVPWAGRKKFLLIGGPFKVYPKGFFSNLFYGGGFAFLQEPGDEKWSKLLDFMYNPNFRNDWGFNFELTFGSRYEADTNYFLRSANLSVWGNGRKYNTNFGGFYGYCYNYNREYLAYQLSSWLYFRYTLTPKLSVSLSSNMWFEWDTLNTLISITPSLTPRIGFRISADMNLEIFNEFVMETPSMNLSRTELLLNRFGLLFSWRFAPKSWLYIAINDHREQNDNGNLHPKSQIGAIKVKYLLYF